MACEDPTHNALQQVYSLHNVSRRLEIVDVVYPLLMCQQTIKSTKRKCVFVLLEWIILKSCSNDHRWNITMFRPTWGTRFALGGFVFSPSWRWRHSCTPSNLVCAHHRGWTGSSRKISGGPQSRTRPGGPTRERECFLKDIRLRHNMCLWLLKEEDQTLDEGLKIRDPWQRWSGDITSSAGWTDVRSPVLGDTHLLWMRVNLTGEEKHVLDYSLRKAKHEKR